MSRKATLSLLAAVLLKAALIVACSAPSSEPPDEPVTPDGEVKKPLSLLQHMIVLDYEDFGPSMLASKLGPAFNQWKSCGHPLPDDVEVNVVVYRGVGLEKVKEVYPVAQGRSDYRYLDYDRALDFLNTNIEMLEELREDKADADWVKMWDDPITTLKRTKATIMRELA